MRLYKANSSPTACKIVSRCFADQLYVYKRFDAHITWILIFDSDYNSKLTIRSWILFTQKKNGLLAVLTRFFC